MEGLFFPPDRQNMKGQGIWDQRDVMTAGWFLNGFWQTSLTTFGCFPTVHLNWATSEMLFTSPAVIAASIEHWATFHCDTVLQWRQAKREERRAFYIAPNSLPVLFELCLALAISLAEQGPLGHTSSFLWDWCQLLFVVGVPLWMQLWLYCLFFKWVLECGVTQTSCEPWIRLKVVLRSE